MVGMVFLILLSCIFIVYWLLCKFIGLVLRAAYPAPVKVQKVVAYSSELQRILALPSRTWTPEYIEQAVEYWTTHLARVPHVRLRPSQAIALSEATVSQGLTIPLDVGAGKTLITALLPIVCKATRPLLVVEANLRRKTQGDFEELRKEWHSHPNIRIVSYSELASDKNRDLLTDYKPDMIMCDEAQAFKYSPARKDRLSGRTRRMMRYLQANPTTRFFGLTGTPTSGSLWDFWPLMRWALGADKMPLPANEAMMQEWAEAVDEKLPPGTWRRQAGALIELNGEGPSDLDKARNGIYRRFATTPGVVMVKQEELKTKLFVRERPLPAPPIVLQAIEELETTGITPNGEEIDTGFELWRHGRALTCGFYQIWTPPAPKEWLAKRKEFSRFVQDMLGQAINVNGKRTILDTPGQVTKYFQEYPAVANWLKIEPTFIPNPKPYWISDYMLPDVKAWLAEGSDKALIWVEHPEVGRQLQRVLGIPYFGGGDQASIDILKHKSACIVSIKAHHAGKNLQWAHRNLITSIPTDGGVMQQLIGRTDRPGQVNDVTFDVYLNTNPARKSFEDVLGKAKAMSALNGVEQKLLRAKMSLHSI